MNREIQMLDIKVNRACTECGLVPDKTKFYPNVVGKVRIMILQFKVLQISIDVIYHLK